MPSEMEYDVTEQASDTPSYKEYLLDHYETMCDLAISLRKSYLNNQQNRDAHFALISISIELWNQIFPKIEKSALKNSFRKWKTFVLEPRLFLMHKYENLIWSFIVHIRMGFEYLGLTKIE